jgi:hypothetical protein
MMLDIARMLASNAMVILSDARQCQESGMSFKVMLDIARTLTSDAMVILSDAKQHHPNAIFL